MFVVTCHHGVFIWMQSKHRAIWSPRLFPSFFFLTGMGQTVVGREQPLALCTALPCLAVSLCSFYLTCLYFLLCLFKFPRLKSSGLVPLQCLTLPNWGDLLPQACQNIFAIQIIIKKFLFCHLIVYNLGLCIWGWLTSPPSVWKNLRGLRIPSGSVCL